ncbi:phospholipid scramblase-related protein [Marinomonas sp. PE14-40]|uniref:phospholipid scramblase-related protein n=1 Tax=Marinomonas sp. PE14-40 TaxID=3060621 RepID=UPI003F66AD45
MSQVINKNLFLVKEHIGLFKAANNFDIYDPENGELIMECREPNLGLITKLLRFTDYKRMTPFDVQIRTPDDQRVVRITRGISIFLSKVEVRDENNELIGGFKQKFLSIGGRFDVLDKNDEVICTLSGKWTGWDFYFKRDDQEFAHVSKKWAGIGQELFSSADNYVLKIAEEIEADHDVRKLILAAVMCIDMVLKE